jgi:hypothetical protein
MEYELVFVALIASLLFIGVTGFYPGGIIVPSYLVLFIHQPSRLFGTLIAALLTHLCYKLVSRYLIVFGRRMFVFGSVGPCDVLLMEVLDHLSGFVIEFRSSDG